MLSIKSQAKLVKEVVTMVTTPIREKNDIELLKTYFLQTHEYRDYTLFVVGINTALRISDLLELKWKDVYNFEQNQYKRHLYMTEKKTKKRACIAINASCMAAFTLLKEENSPVSSEEYIFFSRKNRYKPLSRNRAYNIIKNAALANNIDGNISCHSLRKTFGYHAWKYGTPPALIMNIYNHSSIEITKRYLSIEQDDKDELFNAMNL